MRAVQWAVFIVGLFLMAVSFPRMFVRDDEKALTRGNFGLDIKDGDSDPSDGVEDAFNRIWDRHRIGHDIKNVVHEWAKARPKLAAKFLPFLALCTGLTGFVVGILI